MASDMRRDSLQPRNRILHVTFNMGYGGTEQVIRQLILNSNPEQFEHEIVCIDGTIGALGETLARNGITVHSLPRRSGLDFQLIRQLRQLLRRRNIDVVHCHQYTPWTYGWFAHWGTGARLVFTEHGRFHPDRYRRKARLLNPLMARTTGHLVAISEATKQALVEYEYLPSKRIQVIYNGIAALDVTASDIAAERQRWQLPENLPILGTVARLDPVKNQSAILRASKTLLDEGLDHRVLLVGDGPERQALEQQANELGLEQQVCFTGFIEQPAPLLGLMDVFLLPSFTEGTSMTLLESMSLGRPAVVTKVGGNPEIVVQNQTGLVIPVDDGPELARALQSLLATPEKRQQLGAAAQQRFEQCFAANVMARHYATLYNRISG